jgi:peptidyl-prolyl cis-trans isomerase A (cyclophilin A)
MLRQIGLPALYFTFLSLAGAQTSASHTAAPAHARSHAPVPELPAVALPTEPGSYAVIYTSMGNIVARLFEADAPKTVANFKGLATGAKPWTDPATGKLQHRPLYSGTMFHRVIPDFMIQGGDPLGTGMGDPGYKFADEVSPKHIFDHAGVLAMANSGPNTNGSQFFITVAPQPHLDGNYSIFGEVVSGQEVADAISKVPRDDNDKPLTPVKIIKIAIRKVSTAAAVSKPPATH